MRTIATRTVTFLCPCCLLGEITAVMDPGEPVDYHTGGGAGVSVGSITDETCQCINSPMVDQDALHDARETAAFEAFVEET